MRKKDEKKLVMYECKGCGYRLWREPKDLSGVYWGRCPGCGRRLFTHGIAVETEESKAIRDSLEKIRKKERESRRRY